jgi:hypothetical protein
LSVLPFLRPSLVLLCCVLLLLLSHVEYAAPKLYMSLNADAPG